MYRFCKEEFISYKNDVGKGKKKKGERKKIFKSLICFRDKMRYFLLSGYKDASWYGEWKSGELERSEN